MLRYAILTLTACTAILAAPITGNAKGVSTLDTRATAGLASITRRDDEDDGGYITQGPNYEDPCNDLLYAILGSEAFEQGCPDSSKVERAQNLAERQADEILDDSPGDVTLLTDILNGPDLSDLLDPEDVNSGSPDYEGV